MNTKTLKTMAMGAIASTTLAGATILTMAPVFAAETANKATPDMIYCYQQSTNPVSVLLTALMFVVVGLTIVRTKRNYNAD